MTKQKRWTCPNGCAGVLAPAKPRKNDVRRYCLDCSKRTGRLVERVAPTLEKKRAVAAVKSVERAKQRKERERAQYEVAGIDAERYMRKLAKLPVFRPCGFGRLVGRPYPALIIHRSKHGFRSIMGRCHGKGRYIELFVHPRWNETTLRDVLLHELVHTLIPTTWTKGGRINHHPRVFYRKLKTAWAQAERKFGKCDGHYTQKPRWIAPEGRVVKSRFLANNELDGGLTQAASLVDTRN